MIEVLTIARTCNPSDIMVLQFSETNVPIYFSINLETLQMTIHPKITPVYVCLYFINYFCFHIVEQFDIPLHNFVVIKKKLKYEIRTALLV